MCFAAYGGDMGEFTNVPKEPSPLNTQVLQVATANSSNFPQECKDCEQLSESTWFGNNTTLNFAVEELGQKVRV